MAAKFSEKYQIQDTNTIGYAIIVVNKFEGKCGVDPRDGTKAETKILTEIFQKLGFETLNFGEVTAEYFLEKMSEIRNGEELQKHSMIALAICSHGLLDYVLFPTQKMLSQSAAPNQVGSLYQTARSDASLTHQVLRDEGKPTKLSVKVIQDSVMSQYLDGKPKLIILNACRVRTDASERLCEGDRFTIFSTKKGLETTKFPFQDQGFVPMFLLKLYESLDDRKYDEDIQTIVTRINSLFSQTKQMKERPEERCELETDRNSKRLVFRQKSRFRKLEELVEELYERDSSVVTGIKGEEKLTINQVQSVTSIAYNEKLKRYYMCDPITSKVIEFNDTFKKFTEFRFDKPLESPRYIKCISAEDCIFVSHELGVLRVNLGEGKQAQENLEEANEYVSPLIAANEKDSILFIVDRFSNRENNSREIIVYSVINKNCIENPPEKIVLSADSFENYSPIVIDMDYRQYHTGQKQILILAYLPSPHLLIHVISDSLPMKFSFHSKHQINNDPCFIASYRNYILLSCPKFDSSITVMDDEDNENFKRLDIDKTQSLLMRENGDAVITSIYGDKCVVYYWKAITQY